MRLALDGDDLQEEEERPRRRWSCRMPPGVRQAGLGGHYLIICRADRLGEDVSEMLDYVPAHFEVIRHVRPKLSCRDVRAVAAGAMPSLPIERGRPGRAAGACAGLQVRRSSAALPPIGDYTRAKASSSTARRWPTGWRSPARPAARWSSAAPPTSWPRQICTATIRRCRCWLRAWARPRPAGCGLMCETTARAAERAPPAAVLLATRPIARASIRRRISSGFKGFLQADGYAGFDASMRRGVVRGRPAGRTSGASSSTCSRPRPRRWRRGRPRADRRPVRHRGRDPRPAAGPAATSPAGRRPAPARSTAGVAATRPGETLGKSPTLAGAIRYALARWTALRRYIDDGTLEIDNNAAERALRAVALGRKNYLFAGSDAGGERAAAIYCLIETAKLNGLDPEAYLARRPRPYRRPPDQPRRRTPALELDNRGRHSSRVDRRTLTRGLGLVS